MPSDASTATVPSAARIGDDAKRLHLAETLVHVSRTVSALETLDEMLTALVELTVRETDAERGTLFLGKAAHLPRLKRDRSLFAQIGGVPADEVLSRGALGQRLLRVGLDGGEFRGGIGGRFTGHREDP